MTSLDATLATHRAMFRDELQLNRLVSRQPPTTLDVNTGQLFSEPGAAIGMTVSGPLLRRIGHPEGYGSVFPWARALWLLKVECRRAHLGHRSAERPYWRGSLCHQAVRLTVIGGDKNLGIGPLSVEQAAGVLRVDNMEPVLLRAFRFIEDTIDDFRAKAEARAREDEGRYTVFEGPVHEHRGLPGMHETDCVQCRRRGAA